MNRNLYRQLAKDNIKKNKESYIPYIISATIMIALFFVVYTIKHEVGSSDFYGSRTMGQILNIGVSITALFSLVFIYYTNNFLLKRRQKELGLYSVLGMEKKHINRVLGFENLYSGGFALLFGILFGGLFSKLMFAFLLNIINLDSSLTLNLTVQPVMVTGLMYILIFLVVGIRNKLKFDKVSPIKLLHGDQKGEKEPKSNWLLGLIGLVAIGIGYYLALSIQNPLDAFLTFLIAALLVIIGTYLTFTSVSIIVIKLLKKNKKFYYQKNNFITLSNMLYRMKQNAIGLANIAILSSAVLVILSTTTSLYVGVEDILDNTFPKDVLTTFVYDGQDPDEIEEIALEHANKNNLKIKDTMSYHHLKFPVTRYGNSFEKVTPDGTSHYVNLINVEDYNQIYGENLDLEDDQVLISGDIDDFNADTINILNEKYDVKNRLESIDLIPADSFDQINLVVSDLKEIEGMEKTANGLDAEKEFYYYPMDYNYYFDIDGKVEDKLVFGSTLREELNQSIARVAVVNDRYTARDDTLSIFGSLFFIGILLGSIFMVATVLIIYYKQITEGYEDKKRFRILQEVGLSKKEVKKTINRQVLFVFFLPLLTAIIHTMAAFPLVSQILQEIDFQNTKLFLSSTAIVIVLFGITYGIIYRWTAKIYYRIVN